VEQRLSEQDNLVVGHQHHIQRQETHAVPLVVAQLYMQMPQIVVAAELLTGLLPNAAEEQH